MKKLILIDANSLIHRAFHALPPFTNAEGKPTGALYGLSTILLKIIREDQPDYIVAFFDRPEPTFRKEIFDDYKIHRPKAPDILISQIIESRNLFHEFGIKTFEIPGFEADDLVGTAVQKFKSLPDTKIEILSGDMDTLQLIDNSKIAVKSLKKGVSETAYYDEAAVILRCGVAPELLPDYKGLVGDTSDNIPGVNGIGPKTAAQIINKYKTLENFFEKGQEEKSYEKIVSQKEQALLSRHLATIRRDAPLEIKDVSEVSYSKLPEENIVSYFEKLGFKSLIQRLRPEIKIGSKKENKKSTNQRTKKDNSPPKSQTLF